MGPIRYFWDVLNQLTRIADELKYQNDLYKGWLDEQDEECVDINQLEEPYYGRALKLHTLSKQAAEKNHAYAVLQRDMMKQQETTPLPEDESKA